MHTKFRPIVTENARRKNSAVSETTEIVSPKVVKPIAISAISAWTKQRNAVPALSLDEGEPEEVNLLKPIPPTADLNASLDEQLSDEQHPEEKPSDEKPSEEQGSESSVGKENSSLNTHKSAPVKATNSLGTSISAKRARSIGHPEVAGELNISQSKQEKNEYLHELEEGKPDSGNAAEEVERTNTQHYMLASLEKEASLTSPSNDSDPLSNESDIPDGFVPATENEESLACDANFELHWDKTSHPRMNDSFDNTLPTSSGTSETEAPTSSDDSNSSDTSGVKKGSSHEVPQFSDVLENEDSSRSDPQELDRNKVSSQNSIPSPPSPPLPNGESCDEAEACSKMRKTSSGNRISLRRMERVPSDKDGTRKGSENPWFQDRSATKEEDDDDEEQSSIKNETLKPPKEKKKKKVRFTRLFRSTKSGEAIDRYDSMGSSSEDISLRPSISNDSSIRTEDPKLQPDAAEQHFEETLSLAVSGKRNLEEVIDALLGLSGRPCDKVMKLLTKYMCSAVVIDAVFMVILEHEHARKAEIPMRSMAPSHARYSPHREALINLFANGPERLRKALLSHNKAKSEILRFFTEDKPEGEVEIPCWISTATNLSKILNGLLSRFPTEITDYIGGKKGVLHLMVKNHVHVPDLMEFVIQLSAANALSKITGEDLRYGAANATGLVLLVREGICDLLVDMFRKSSIATAQGEGHLLEWQTQVMSAHCLLELSKRATVIPRFTKDNCSYSSRYIKALNSSLDDLSLYVHDARVLSLLNSGFDAISDGPEIENTLEQSERNNPLVCALAVITDILETVRNAAGSKLAVTRKTVGSISTEKIEKHVVSKMARLCKLLHRKSAHEVSCRTKVAIVNVFRCLCSSRYESTRLSMVKSKIPDRLMALIRENERSSVLHCCVLKCLSASFNSANSIELHRDWLRALARSDGWLQVMYEYFHKVDEGEKHGYKPFFHTFVAIGFQVVDFCQDDKETKLRPMLQSKAEQQTYVDSIEAGLNKLRKEYETPCGGPKPSERAVSVLANAESLAARLHDFNAV